MYPYYQLLNLPSPLKDGVTLPASDKGEEIFMVSHREFLNDELLRVLRDVKLVPVGILLFHHCPGYSKQRVHIDGHDGQFVFGINWIFSKDQCMTSWYEVHEDPDVGFSNTKASVPYLAWFDDQCTMVASTTDKGPFIANASIPHKGQNLDGTSDRWSLSLRFFPNMVKSFDQAVSILSPFKRT